MNNGVPDAPNSLFPHTLPDAPGSSSDNTIIVISGTVIGNIYGAIGESLNAYNNKVLITGGQVGTTGGVAAARGNVFGALSAGNNGDANVIGNAIEIENATVLQSIYGAKVVRGSNMKANYNTVVLGAGVTIGGSIYGVYSQASGEIVGNSVEINGANATKSGSIISGGYGLASTGISGNSVTVISGTIRDAEIFGGRLQGTVSGSAVTNNKVIITGGTITAITGSIPGIYGGHTGSNTGVASGNEVRITGGNVTAAGIYGGAASSNGSARDNTVELSGGTIVGGFVYGGHSAATGATTNNTVTLSGATILDISGQPNSGIYGGNQADFTGNTLNVWNYTGSSSVANVAHFQYYNFLLPASLQGALNVTGTVDFNGSGTTSTVTGVDIMGGGSAPQLGATIPLIQATGLAGIVDNDGATFDVKKGATLDVSLQLHQSTDLLYVTVAGVRAAPEAKDPSQGHLADTVLVNQGANMVAGAGLAEALRIGRHNQLVGDKALFGIIEGGSIRQKTGSHLDMESFSLMTGATATRFVNAGEVNFGAFIEHGNGHYDSYNKFANGDGRAHYWGGGILGRMDFTETDTGNYYLEGSLRAGRVHNRYNSDLLDSSGRHYVRFRTSAGYGSVHLGGGYRWKLGNDSAFNLYGQTFYSRQGGDSVQLSTGDPVKFEAVNSIRARVGGRYEWTLKNVKPYAGLAYEHEFDGKAKASTYGYRIDAPALSGGTGIVEGGIVMKPAPNHPVTVNLGIQGYAGNQKGVTGTFRFRYAF